MANDNLNKWDDFCGTNFLKAEHIKDKEDFVTVVKVETHTDEDNSVRPRLTVEGMNNKFLFDLNVTNSNFCKNNSIKTPKDLIGKKLYFRKVTVTNPKTKLEVESLRIDKIENIE